MTSYMLLSIQKGVITITNKQVAQAFAQGKTYGHSLNMFIDGETVYSYGYHFPIARITYQVDSKGNKIALFTTRGYSNTTSKHKGHVYQALRDYRIIEVDNVEEVNSDTINQLSKESSDLLAKASRARKEANKVYYNLLSSQKMIDSIDLKLAYNLA